MSAGREKKSLVLGVSRLADNEQSLLVSFRTRPPDTVLRALHDLARLACDGETFTFDQWALDQTGFDLESGAPGIGTFANALQLWSIYQDQPVSVALAAVVFNVEPRRIIEAVEWHFWMFLTGPHDDYTRLMIEHEGE